MPPSRIRLARALALSILGIVTGLAGALWTPDGLSRQEAVGPLMEAFPADAVEVLGRLELSAKQKGQIEDLRARERSWIEELQCALAQSERDLRSAEMEQPFDAERVNDLVSSQAELIAYLRGTESRVIAEIARLLTPDQERRFSEMRTSAPDAPRSSVFSSLHPRSAPCPGVRAAVPEPPVRVAPSRRETNGRGGRPEPGPRIAPQLGMLAAA